MLPRNKKQKGKQLEKFVASELKKIFKYVFARADSGSGKWHKEDITLPDNIPLAIECKNHAEPKINEWMSELYIKTPPEKYPVLIYKTNYQKPKVVMRFGDLINFISKQNTKYDWQLLFLITLDFNSFINLLEYLYGKSNTKTSI